MNTSYIPMVIGMVGSAIVSLLSVWFAHYLTIRREFLFRKSSDQQNVLSPVEKTQRRSVVLRVWRRSLFAIAVCPFVDLVILSCGVNWYMGIGGFLDEVLTVGPWFYASCIAILFPLLLFFYHRVDRQRTRLIFAILAWCILTLLYFLVGTIIVYPGVPTEYLKLIAILGVVGGSVSGLLYWLIASRGKTANGND